MRAYSSVNGYKGALGRNGHRGLFECNGYLSVTERNGYTYKGVFEHAQSGQPVYGVN